MVNQEIDNLLTLRIQATNDIRMLAQYYLLPEKLTEQPKDAIVAAEYARKLAMATAAVEVVCCVVNMFGTMAGIKNFSSSNAIADLTFGLNVNTFWSANANYLMPILSMAVNAFQDNITLKAQQQPLWAPLEYHHSSSWLEVLPAILFCLKGYSAMREKSLEMKQSFEKFLKVS